MEILQSILANQVVAFIIVVGVVVFAHELGHYLVARWLGIRVEEFSIGFGPRAFSFRRGDTEYRLGWIPLGGYVRLFGAEPGREVPPELRDRAITTAALWKRFSVAGAGPLANVVVTFIVLSILSLHGVEKIPPRVSVLPGSVAAEAGLRDGDLIEAIDERPILSWEELTQTVSQRPNELLAVKIRRESDVSLVSVRPALVSDESVFGEKVQVGRIGVSPYFQTPSVALTRDSPLWAAGLRFGDTVLRVGAAPIRHFHEIEQHLAHWATGPATDPLILSVSDGKGAPREVVLAPELAKELRGGTRLLSTDVAFAGFAEGERAQRASAAIESWRQCGLSSGDAIAGAEGFGDIHSRVQLSQWVETVEKGLAPGTAKADVRLRVWKTDGGTKTLDCAITLRQGRDHLNRSRAFLDLPFRFVTQGTTAAPIVVRSEGIPDALRDGAVQTWNLAGSIFETIGKLVTGRIPMANLGGPIEIARVAGTAASVGLVAFITMIAFISLNVGLLNLLPIPVLDGGTLLLLALEALYGKPLPQRLQEAVQRFGIIFIVGLVLLVIYNDILRRFS